MKTKTSFQKKTSKTVADRVSAGPGNKSDHRLQEPIVVAPL